MSRRTKVRLSYVPFLISVHDYLAKSDKVLLCRKKCVCVDYRSLSFQCLCPGEAEPRAKERSRFIILERMLLPRVSSDLPRQSKAAALKLLGCAILSSWALWGKGGWVFFTRARVRAPAHTHTHKYPLMSITSIHRHSPTPKHSAVLHAVMSSSPLLLFRNMHLSSLSQRPCQLNVVRPVWTYNWNAWNTNRRVLVDVFYENKAYSYFHRILNISLTTMTTSSVAKCVCCSLFVLLSNLTITVTCYMHRKALLRSYLKSTFLHDARGISFQLPSRKIETNTKQCSVHRRVSCDWELSVVLNCW